MSHTATWKRFGDVIASHPQRTLAAYLGHTGSKHSLRSDSIPFPTAEYFLADRVFDPNPHQLKIPEELLETSLLVNSLAVWGPEVLIRTAYGCAVLQIEKQTKCREDLRTLRDNVFEAVKAYLQSSTSSNKRLVKEASECCFKLYAPYEDDPDSLESGTIWSHLGAPWFAAEVAVQDDKLAAYDGLGPREASSSWCTRNAVWVSRAAESAAEWSSHDNVRATIRETLINWIIEEQDS